MFASSRSTILYDVRQFDYLGGIDFLFQMFQWMIEAFPCFLNIELRFRIILVPLDDLIPVFGIEQDTGMALRELRQHFLQGGRIERTCLLVHIEMIDGRPFFFAVLIKVGVLPIPFPFFKEFERIEESPVSFGGHYFVC